MKFECIVYTICHLPPSQYCQAVFALLAIGILAVAALPDSTRRYLLDYGARETKATAQTDDEPGTLERLVATLAAHSQVPHAWFSSFYIVYLICAAGWATQYLLWRLDWPGGELFAWLIERQRNSKLAYTTMPQVYTAWGLMIFQAGRRLYEQTYVFKPSKSKMNIAHWVLGLAFYLCVSMAVWIEGARAYISHKVPKLQGCKFLFWSNCLAEAIAATKDSAVQARSAGKREWTYIAAGTTVFLLSNLEQSRCHRYLASLKKYSLPDKGSFKDFVCPHYTYEVQIYVALAAVSGIPANYMNPTLLAASVFVAVCLGVTASRTKKWYIEKFGREQVAKKWKMISFIF